MLNINFSTILLQMANFFILAFILYRFLFKPLQNMMNKRAEITNRSLDDAEAARVAAEAARLEYEEKTENIDAEIAARKNEARIVIQQTRQQMLKDVNTQVERIQKQTEEALAKLRAEAVQQHRAELAGLVSQFATNLMTDLMSPRVQEVFQEEFLQRIEKMQLSDYVDDAKINETEFIKAIMAVEPAEDYQQRLIDLLHNQIKQPFNLTFEVDPQLIAGGLLRFENELIDGSLKGQIEKLTQTYQDTL